MSYTHQNLAARAGSPTAIKVGDWVLDDFGGKFAPSGFRNDGVHTLEIYCSDEGLRVALDEDFWRADIPWAVLYAFMEMCEKWNGKGRVVEHPNGV